MQPKIEWQKFSKKSTGCVWGVGEGHFNFHDMSVVALSANCKKKQVETGFKDCATDRKGSKVNITHYTTWALRPYTKACLFKLLYHMSISL